ncbi:hypothetical protein GYA19_02435 [Candidatus Beckwithbacteria bacterium]|nr:hypothetical protein [Candidatus Beckwithbacteria bacterium]
MAEKTGKTIELGSAEAKKIASEAMQRHHDYYVGLEQAGKLPEDDKPNLALAKQREQAGQVKPFVPPTEAPVGGSGK